MDSLGSVFCSTIWRPLPSGCCCKCIFAQSSPWSVWVFFSWNFCHSEHRSQTETSCPLSTSLSKVEHSDWSPISTLWKVSFYWFCARLRWSQSRTWELILCSGPFIFLIFRWTFFWGFRFLYQCKSWQCCLRRRGRWFKGSLFSSLFKRLGFWWWFDRINRWEGSGIFSWVETLRGIGTSLPVRLSSCTAQLFSAIWILRLFDLLVLLLPKSLCLSCAGFFLPYCLLCWQIMKEKESYHLLFKTYPRDNFCFYFWTHFNSWFWSKTNHFPFLCTWELMLFLNWFWIVFFRWLDFKIY